MECHRKYTREYKKAHREQTRVNNQKWYDGFRKAHPEKHNAKTRKSLLKRKYGLTPEQYGEVMKSTGGVCEICRQTNQKLVLDHNHETGEVRGVLCVMCNTALGMLKDSISRALSAAAYLNERGSYGR